MTIKPDSKYYPLYDQLRRSGESRIIFTFNEIETLIGDRLPASARAGRSFWSNRSGGAIQATAWMAAGYHVVDVDFTIGRVTFERPVVSYTVRREGDTILWDGTMVRALRVHLGANQAELAELLGVRQQTISEWETAAYTPTRARSKHLTMVAERVGFSFAEGKQLAKVARKVDIDNKPDTV